MSSLAGVAELVNQQQARIDQLDSQYGSILDEVDRLLEQLQSGQTSNALGAVESTLKNIKQAEKHIHQAVTKYGKAVGTALPPAVSHQDSVFGEEQMADADRAIALHLLRRGHVDTVKAFAEENPNLDQAALPIKDFLQLQRIMAALEVNDFQPALLWAEENRNILLMQNSDLEFSLHKIVLLQMLAEGHKSTYDPKVPILYARKHLSRLASRHFAEISQLMGAIITSKADYQPFAFPQLHDTVASVRRQFENDYCAWLGLAPESPVELTAHAGYIALPVLEKMQTVMKMRSAEWTSSEELPVEIDLPESLHFHPIFVCPVSKEQTTQSKNPPYLLPCGHIISDATVKSLVNASVSKRIFKCPYCPQSAAFDALQKVTF